MQKIEQHSNGRNVNVTLDILRIYEGSKERLELLAACMLFKTWHSNGVVQNVTVDNLAKWMHCGRNRAKRIFEGIQTDSYLFEFNGKSVRTHSLRDKTKKYNKYGRCYSGAECIRIKGNQDYTLKQIYDKLRERVVESYIKGTMRKTTYECAKNNSDDSVLPSSILPSRTMASSLGVSISTISRLTNKMAKNGDIVKKAAIMLYVCDRDNRAEIEETARLMGFKRQSFNQRNKAFFILPCRYSINSWEAKLSVRHKIYGYRKRRKTEKKYTMSNGDRLTKEERLWRTIPQLCGE